MALTSPPLNMKLKVVVVLFLCQMLEAYHAEFTNDRKRIGPLDVVRAEHGCLEKFEVSESTIIRTKDSREVGAKFLNESDVGNREDCLTLCCSVHLCNVVVFDEKGAGACYMFDCGPPEDFKCKFTSHETYTSAVLRLNRHQLELRTWSEQSQHEAELANLRSPLELEASLSAPSSTRIRAPTTPSTSLPKTTSTIPSTTTIATTTTTTVKPTLPPRKCSRFQFECHNGECIAIYNVCDGIPQCKDKSDEDSALRCPVVPTEGSTALVRGAGSAPAPNAAWDNQSPPRDNGYASGYDRGIFNHRSNLLENYSHYPPSGGHGSSSPAEEGGGYGGRGRGPTYYDYNQRPAWPGPRYNVGEGGARSTGTEFVGSEPHHSFHYPDYGQPQPLQQPLQQPQQQQQQQQQPPQPPPQPQQQQPQSSLQMNNPVWMDKPSYPSQQQQMQDMQHMNVAPGMQQQRQQSSTMQQQMVPFQQPSTNKQQQLSGFQGNMQNTEMGMMGRGNVQIPANQMQEFKTSHSTRAPPTTVPSKPSSENSSSSSSSNNINNKTTPDGKTGSGSSSTTGGGSGGGGGSSSKHSPAAPGHEPPHSVAHSSMARLEVNLEELQIEAREQDAQASGAVLALAMGVCITALLVVLVGCRLRGVRRRLRKHRGARSPYAHDADYLVNGMYL